MIAEEFRAALRDQRGNGRGLSLEGLCAACEQVMAMRASVVLASDGVHAAGATSGGVAALDELQQMLGEGPGIDADRDGRPVLVDDLTTAVARWPQFVPAALARGVTSVFAFPLQAGGIRNGVLSLYTDGPPGHAGETVEGEGRLGDMVTLATLVTDVVLSMQTDGGTDELGWSLSNSAEHRAVVHQATGMVAMQLECPVRDAFTRLRAAAYTENVDIDVIARQVVDRLRRFER